MANLRVLNLGCGTRKNEFPEAGRASEVVGVDFRPMAGVDVVHDLDRFPWPFADSRFDLVILQDVIEHLEDVPKVMAQVHRVSAAGAEVRIRTPHYSSWYAYGDPTHRHTFSSQSFESFHSPDGNTYSPEARYRLVARRILFPRVWRLLGVSALANRYPVRWEQLFAFVFRAENLEVVLRVEK